MTKNDRSHVEEVYVIGFVPSYKVPNLPESFDPFLEPLKIYAQVSFLDTRLITLKMSQWKTLRYLQRRLSDC